MIEIRANSTNWKKDFFLKGALKSLGSDSKPTHKCDLKRSDSESDCQSALKSDLESDTKDFKAPLTKKSFFQLVEFALISITC